MKKSQAHSGIDVQNEEMREIEACTFVCVHQERVHPFLLHGSLDPGNGVAACCHPHVPHERSISWKWDQFL